MNNVSRILRRKDIIYALSRWTSADWKIIRRASYEKSLQHGERDNLICRLIIERAMRERSIKTGRIYRGTAMSEDRLIRVKSKGYIHVRHMTSWSKSLNTAGFFADQSSVKDDQIPIVLCWENGYGLCTEEVGYGTGEREIIVAARTFRIVSSEVISVMGASYDEVVNVCKITIK